MDSPSGAAEGTGAAASAREGSRFAGVVGDASLRGTLVDAAVTVVATLLAALGFRNTFGGSTWLVVGAVGVVAAVAVGAVAAARRWSPLATLGAALLTFVVAGGVAVPDAAIAGFLPGPGVPSALVDGATHGWARVLTTIPPVDTTDNLATIVYLSTFLAGFIGITLARRTEVPLAPALPPLAVLVCAILIGTDEIPAVILQGAVLFALLLGWSAYRARRRRKEIHLETSSTGHQRITSLAFLGAVAAGAVVLAPHLPGASTPSRYVLRTHTEPPFDPRAYASPLNQYKQWRNRAQPPGEKKPGTKAVLVARGLPEGVPVKLASLDVYDGTAWLVGSSDVGGDVTGSSRFERVGDRLHSGTSRQPGEAPAVTSGTTRRARVVIENRGYEGPWVPTVPGATRIVPGGDRATELFRALRYNSATTTVGSTMAFAPGDRVTIDATIPAVAHASAKTRAELVGKRGIESVVVLPSIEDPTGSLSSKANNLSAGGEGTFGQAVAIEQALTAKDASYFSDGRDDAGRTFTAGHNAAKLSQFLSLTNDDRPVYIGNAEKFAASMAALARSLGLPARVVVGFREAANDKNPAKRVGDTVTFTADQYDAWVEIAFEDVGWVSFFPTPPRKNGTPPPPKSSEPQVKEAELQARPPVEPPPNLNEILPQKRKGNEKAKPDADDEALVELPSWLLTALKVVGSVVLVVGAVVGGVLGWKRRRTKRRRERGTSVDQAAGAWRQMVDHLRDAGTVVPKQGTRRQVAAEVPEGSWTGAIPFATDVDRVMFGPDDPTPERVTALWERVDDLREDLTADMNRADRLRFALNPATLWGWR